MNTLRIPEYDEKPGLDGVSEWFSSMFDSELLFHPDDSPEEIVNVATGEKLFSIGECGRLNRIMDRMFSKYGDKVYEMAYPYFMKAIHPDF